MKHLVVRKTYNMLFHKDLGPLLFKKHRCDLFYFLKDLHIASYVDDTAI